MYSGLQSAILGTIFFTCSFILKFHLFFLIKLLIKRNKICLIKAVFESFLNVPILVISFFPHSPMVLYDIFVTLSRIFFAPEFYFAFESLVIFASLTMCTGPADPQSLFHFAFLRPLERWNGFTDMPLICL